MPVIRKKKHRKKVRYSKIVIKLSAKQKKSLVNYCKARKTTPAKLIKKSIRRFINGFDKEVPLEYYATENQLQLFNENNEHYDFTDNSPAFAAAGKDK
ncbi:MAG: hypothetical protein FJY07_04385 [Bacteroidetes bacterium]|nr:hypothetical protein [Bacteroidota bacterium]